MIVSGPSCILAMLRHMENISTIESQIEEVEAMLRTRTDLPKAEQLGLQLWPQLEAVSKENTGSLPTRLAISLSSIIRARGAAASALDYAEEALRRSDFVSDLVYRAKALSEKGFVLSALSRYDDASKCFDEAIELFKTLNLEKYTAAIYGELGVNATKVSDYGQALRHYTKALEIDRQFEDMAGVARHTGNLGNLYKSSGDYNSAIRHYNEALSIAKERQDATSISINIGNIGSVYNRLGDYERSIELFHEALRIAEQIQKADYITLWIGYLGCAYSDMGQSTKAVEYFLQALAIAEEIDNKILLVSWLGSLGQEYMALKDFDSSFSYLHRAVTISEEIKDIRATTDLYKSIGQLFGLDDYANKDYVRSEQYILKALALAEQAHNHRELVECHKALNALYKRVERWEEAHRHLEVLIQLEKESEREKAHSLAIRLDFERGQAERDKAQAVVAAQIQSRIESQEQLLHRILPRQVAERLLRGEVIADYFQNISILFADIVGFTPIAARMPAKAVLALLNYVFREFDAVMERHGCQKIKTIGDGYMAVCGAPDFREDHAECMADAALELLRGFELTDEIRATLPKGSSFSIRVGIHTGPAFAGIVGSSGFVYDVYSDAVNIASRLESTGLAGKIHCSEEFALHLQNRSDRFVLRERGEIELKGKGSAYTYFIEEKTS